MGWNKSTVDLSGFNQVEDVLDHLGVSYQVDTLCTIKDRGARGVRMKKDDIELKFISSPNEAGGFYQKILHNPGPDSNDQIVLEKTDNNIPGDLVVLEKKRFTDYEEKKEEYTVEEVKNDEHLQVA